MAKTIAITADSPVDLGTQYASRFGISIIPLYIHLDGYTYRDGVDITPDDIFHKYETEKFLPTTSAIPVGDYTDFFRSFSDKGQTVVHLSLSSEISATHQNARIAAEEFENVYVLNTLNLSVGIAILALAACDMRDRGLDALTIVRELEAMRGKVHSSFVIDKLEFLRKGGRCSALTALGANILNIHPSIEVIEGSLHLAKKYRGAIRAVQLQYIDDVLENPETAEKERAILCHSGIPDAQLDALLERIQQKGVFREVLVSRAGCTISTHCGPNCIGLMFRQK